ncbi:flagellar hook protein FlgE [Aestuariispira ectoiniformans]|uniref:flagellar hook protein FlgE n=1 Tax=Aestuariispira ectoiniformans TaxID=2775080 RepID=UPI00223C0D3B|nr:flagellar hook-basal body complex protein [Aestuariispira ectoiniformans]
MVANYFFSSSLSAMRAQSQAFAAISDNISNISTAGYKTSQVQFDSLVSRSQKGSLYQNLNGAGPQVRNLINRDGQVAYTNRNLDAAMVGRGFFYTNSALDNSGDTLLTKAGHFGRLQDSDPTTTNAYLSDGFGNYVMGWPYVPASDSFAVGTNESSLQPIRVDQGGIIFNASPSTTGSIAANLSADAAIGTSQSYSLDVLDGSGVERDANGFVIQSSDKQNMTFNWTKTAANTWDLNINSTDGTITSPAAADFPISVTFDSTGLNPVMTTAGGTVLGDDVDVSASWTTPAGASNTVSVDLSGITQYAGGFELRSVDSNGIEEGFLMDVSVDNDGIVQGAFSNGLSRPIAMLAVADVRAENLLDRVSNTHFAVTEESGDISLYRPDQTTRVAITGGAYEASATNLTDEVSLMIQTQRAYSSAATSLRTIDEMSQTATQLK